MKSEERYSEYPEVVRILLTQIYPVHHVVFLTLILGSILVCIMLNRLDAGTSKRMTGDMDLFQPELSNQVYGQITPYYLSVDLKIESSADRYVLVLDQDKKPYIVFLSKEEKAKYSAVYNFTYFGDPAPENVSAMKGKVKKIPGEIKESVVDCYSSMALDAAVSMDNFEEVFGRYMLDTTAGDGDHLGIIIILMIFIVVASIEYVKLIRLDMLRRIRTKAALRRFMPGMMHHIINSLSDPETLHCEDAQIYLTREYLVSLKYGFVAIRYQDIKDIYYTLKMKSRTSSTVWIYAVKKGKKKLILGDTNDRYETRCEVQSFIDEARDRIRQGKR